MTFPGEALLGKMWETLAERGVGGLLRPWAIRREGRAHSDARAHDIRVLAQAESDAAAIRAGTKRLGSGGLVTDVPDEKPSQQVIATSTPGDPRPQLLAAVTSARMADDVRREVNVAHAILHAEAELQDSEAKASDQPIAADWLYRWRDSAGAVSADELRQLWGRVLAGEVKAPGSVSFRTMSFLRDIDREDAQRIQLLAPFAIDDTVFRAPGDLLEREGLHFGFLLQMQELGVLSGVGGLGLEVKMKSDVDARFEKAFACSNRLLLARHDEPTKTLTVPVYKITQLGRQLLSLGEVEANEVYLRALAAAIRSQGFETTIASIVSRDGNAVRFRDSEKLEDHEGAT